MGTSDPRFDAPDMTNRHDDAERPQFEPSLPDRDLPRLPPPTAPEVVPVAPLVFGGRPTFPVTAARPITPRRRGRRRGPWAILVLAVLAAGGGAAYLANAERDDARMADPATSEVPVDTSSAVDGALEPTTTLPDQLGAPYIGPLTFGWSAGCTVPVSETVTRRGRTAELTYALRIDADPAGLLISFVDMTVLTIDGQVVPPDVAEQAVAVFLLPSFVVNHDGAVVEIRGMEEMIEKLIALVPEMAPMAGPEYIALLEDWVASKYWESWGGFWAGYDSVDELSYRATVDVPTGDATVETDVVVESLGTTAAGDAMLRFQHVAEGDDLLAANGTMMAELGVDASAFTTARRVVTVDSTTDPDTLRPSTVSMFMDTEIGNGVESRIEVEAHDWTFDWSAPGCGG